MGFTGDMFSFFDNTIAMGASIKTVATLSIKAEIKPAKRDRHTIIHFTSGTLFIILSAMRCGILDSVKRATKPIVPAIIKITFQSMAKKTSLKGSIPKSTKIRADEQATMGLWFVRVIIKIYVSPNKTAAKMRGSVTMVIS